MTCREYVKWKESGEKSIFSELELLCKYRNSKQIYFLLFRVFLLGVHTLLFAIEKEKTETKL